MTLLSGDGVHSSRQLAADWRAYKHAGRSVVGYMTDDTRATLSMLIDKFRVESVIEIGSLFGLSACFFAEQVDEVTCVDTFTYGGGKIWPRDVLNTMDVELGPADQYELFKRNTAAYPNVTSYKFDSLTAADELDVTVDLVYIDADHTYEGVKADVEAWTPHARKVICGDDNTDKWPGVMRYAREIGANVEERIWWLSLS